MHRRLTLILVTAALATGAAACGSATEPPRQTPAARTEPSGPAAAPRTPPSPAPFTSPADEPRGYTGDLPPLPVPAFAAARPPQIVQAVYTFAARHPEVLRYVPCFCGCESRGHTDNEDCFIAGRDANGRPRWEEHGMG